MTDRETKKEWWNKVDEVANDLEWWTGDSLEYGDDWCFITSSPEGQDCVIEVRGETFEELANAVMNWADNFDVSEETYIWLDNFGHGTNGAPYDMRDCYEDMEWFKDKAMELAFALKEAANEI